MTKLKLDINRRWVARDFAVWRTHIRTSIIDPHALPHRTSIFDDRTRTRTRTFTFSKISISKKNVLLQLFLIFIFFYLTTYYYTHTNPSIFHYLPTPDTFTTRTCTFCKSIFFQHILGCFKSDKISCFGTSFFLI